jgi:hypothetical protein
MLAIVAAYAMELGRVDDAASSARRSLELSSGMRDPMNMTWGLITMAWAAAARGEAGRAGVLWGAMEAEEARTPITWEEGERERYEASVLKVAGPEFDQGRVRGRHLSLEEAVEYALGDRPGVVASQ